MDFERWQARITALMVEVVRSTLGFRFGRDDHRIHVRAHPGRALRVVELRYLEGGRVRIAHVPEFGGETLASVLEVAESSACEGSLRVRVARAVGVRPTMTWPSPRPSWLAV